MREIWVATVFALALAGTHPAAAQAPKPDNAPGGTATAASLLAPNPQDRVLGKADAPITIVEYASLSCSHCARFADAVLPKLKEKWIDTGKAKLILRDFPLDEPALRAAMVARCAPPERFYTVIDGFFRAQSEWAAERSKLKGVAVILGIKSQQFDTCLNDKALEDQVAQSRLTAAQQLGVNSTPTFFINGKKYEGEPTIEAFEQLLSGLAAKS